MIMISHGVYPLLDYNKPASISYKITTDILRKRLHYNGVVITDDLTMGALKNYGNIGQRAVDAIKAGADIVLIYGNEEQAKQSYLYVLKAVENHEIPISRIKQSVRRILILKKSLA